MEISSHLSFKGDCEAAFTLYAQCLGGTIGPLFRYGGSPAAHQVSADWQDKIMHGSVTVAGHTLMGSDVPAERYEALEGFALSLQIKAVEDAERIFAALAAEGRVVMPLEKTFWAERFGHVVDRFGVPWLINCEG